MSNFQDNLSQLFDIPELQRQQEAAVKFVKDYLKEVTDTANKIKSLDLTIGGANDLKTLQDLIKQASALSKETAANTVKLADAKLKDAKASTEQAKATEANSRAELNNAKTKELSTKASERQKKAVIDQGNAYEVLKKKYRETSNEAKRLGIELGVEDARFKAAAASAHAMHTQLLSVESSVGQMQRQVGNYNVVGMQFQQLLRELPNAGLGARTFVMAISNNISYFAEAVAASIKQGDGWKSVFKSVGSSLFSVVGIINIAVTALTFFTTAMTKNKEEAKSAADIYDELAQSVKKYTDASLASTKAIRRVVGASAEDARRELELLQAKGANEKVIADARKKYNAAVKKDAETEIQLYDDIIAAVNVYSKEWQDLQLAQGKGLAQQEYERVFVKPLAEVLRARLNLSEEQAKKEAERLGKNPEVIAELTKQKDEAVQIFKDAENAQLISDAQYQKELTEQQKKALRERMQTLRDAEKERGGMSLLPTTEQINAQIKEYENQNLAKRLQSALFNSEQSETNALTALEKKFSQGLISAEQYEAEKLRIQNDYAAQRVQLEIDTTKKLLANGGMEEAERLKFIARLNELELDMAKQGNDDKLKADEEYKKASVKVEEERAQNIKAIRSGLANEVVGIANAIYARQLQQHDTEMKNLDAETNKKRLQIQSELISSEEKERRIAELELSTQLKREQIEARKVEIQRRQAQFEKAISVASITAKTAEAIMAALKIPVYGEALAIGYGILGAAQIAKVMATPIPAYAEGTENHPGGPAIVGEGKKGNGYRKELVKTGASTFIVDKPTYIPDLPAHSQVIPMPDKVNIADMVPVLRHYDERNIQQLQFNTEEIVSASKDIVRAINRKPVPVFKTIGYDWKSYKSNKI